MWEALELVIEGYPNFDLNSGRPIEPKGQGESIGFISKRLQRQ